MIHICFNYMKLNNFLVIQKPLYSKQRHWYIKAHYIRHLQAYMKIHPYYTLVSDWYAYINLMYACYVPDIVCFYTYEHLPIYLLKQKVNYGAVKY